jgi:hypothetical protein
MSVDPYKITTVPSPPRPNESFTVWYEVVNDSGETMEPHRDCIQITGNGYDITVYADVGTTNEPNSLYGASAQVDGLPPGEYWISISPKCEGNAGGTVVSVAQASPL